MILKNKDILTFLMVLGFTFCQPLDMSQGQVNDTELKEPIKQIIDPSPITKDYIDTVSIKYNKFSKLVDKSKSNVDVAKGQSSKLIKDAAEISQQQRIIDSLIKVKETKSKNSDKSQTGKAIKSWKIFHLFDKKS